MIRHWGLWGQVAVRGIGADDLDLLEAVLKRVAGEVDVHLQLTLEAEDLEAAALRLLNAGGSRLIVAESTPISFSQLPVDRTRRIVIEDGADQAIDPNCWVELQQPSADRLAELEMARLDTLVPVDQIEQQPDLVIDFFESVLVSDRPDGLWPTVIVDPLGMALGLAYSDRESLAHAMQHRVGAYHSRSRDGLWIKGESSGATQSLLTVRMDCDRDALQFRVTQDPPGFCHRDTYTCFGDHRSIVSVMHRLQDRMEEQDEKSFTRKLAHDADLLEAKLLEEAGELSAASRESDTAEVTWEAADVLYFSLVAMLKQGVTLDSVYAELARRMNRVVRRKNKLESGDQDQ